MKALSEAEIQNQLVTRKGWVFTNNTIRKEYQFPAYLDGIHFVNKLAQAAEQMNHHPDITIGWCQVTVSLSTHDAHGITDLDFQLADRADSLT